MSSWITIATFDGTLLSRELSHEVQVRSNARCATTVYLQSKKYHMLGTMRYGPVYDYLPQYYLHLPV